MMVTGTSSMSLFASSVSSKTGSATAKTDGHPLSAAAEKLGEGGAGSKLTNSLLEELEKGQGVASALKKSIESMKDGERSQKINFLKQKIEQLKEQLKFATPEQAKRLARELKKLGKEFKQVASSLNGSSGITSSVASAGAGASSSLAASKSAAADTNAAAAATNQPLVASGTDQALPASQPQASKPDAPKNPDGFAGTDGETADKTPNADPKITQAINAYLAADKAAQATGETEQSGETALQSGSAKEGHAEELREISQELKYLTARIEQLVKQSEDEEAAKELKKAKEDMKDGEQELRTFESDQAQSSGSMETGSGPAMPNLTQTATTNIAVSVTVDPGILI